MSDQSIVVVCFTSNECGHCKVLRGPSPIPYVRDEEKNPPRVIPGNRRKGYAWTSELFNDILSVAPKARIISINFPTLRARDIESVYEMIPTENGRFSPKHLSVSQVPPPGSLTPYIKSFPGWMFVDGSEWNRSVLQSSGYASEGGMYAVVPRKKTKCISYGYGGLEKFDIFPDEKYSSISSIPVDPVVDLQRAIEDRSIVPSITRHPDTISIGYQLLPGVPHPNSKAIRMWRSNSPVGGIRIISGKHEEE